MLTPAEGAPDPAAQAVIQGAIYQRALGMFLIRSVGSDSARADTDSWAFLCAIYTIASTRINVVLTTIFFAMTMLLTLLGGSFMAFADGKLSRGRHMTTAAGAFGFVATVFGWYLLSSLIFGLVCVLATVEQR